MKRFALFATVLICGRFALAEPVTRDRLAALPADQKTAWAAYLDQSDAAAKAEQAAIAADAAKAGLKSPLPAPDGGDFKLSHKPGDPWFASDEAQQLAAVVLSYQTPSGGWSKHTGYTKGPRKPGMLFSSQYKPGAKPHYGNTFDNRSTTEQLYFLAYLFEATKNDVYRQAFLRGLDYVLAAQFPTGGWPQVYPLEGGYHDHVTFNDDAMTRVMGLLKSFDESPATFAFIDDARRQKAAAALKKGVQFVIDAQVVVNGKKTVWCAQHDPITLAAAGARAFEPAALSGMESARLIEFLMRDEKPSESMIEAIESGLAWFEQAKITNVIMTKTPAGKTTYEEKPAGDASGGETYWARFYDLTDGHPIFPGRDQKPYRTYAEMAQGNNVGYDYYTTLPKSLVTTKQKEWRKKIGR